MVFVSAAPRSRAHWQLPSVSAYMPAQFQSPMLFNSSTFCNVHVPRVFGSHIHAGAPFQLLRASDEWDKETEVSEGSDMLQEQMGCLQKKLQSVTEASARAVIKGPSQSRSTGENSAVCGGHMIELPYTDIHREERHDEYQ